MAIKPTDQEIGKLYQEGGATGPSEALDRSILMAARAAVKDKATAPRWIRWRLPLQALATICLVVIVTVLVDHRDASLPAIPSLAMNDKSLEAHTGPAAPAATSPAPVVAEFRANLAEQLPARTRSAANQAPPALAPAPATAVPAQYPSAAKEGLPASAPAGNAVVSDSVAPSTARAEAGAAATSAKAASRIADDKAASPREWLDSIQALIAEHRLAEARQRLDAFVRAYPGETVPEAIRARLKAASDGEHTDKP